MLIPLGSIPAADYRVHNVGSSEWGLEAVCRVGSSFEIIYSGWNGIRTFWNADQVRQQMIFLCPLTRALVALMVL